MKRILAVISILILSATGAWSQPEETQPKWETIDTPPAEQVRIFEELASKTVASAYLTDDEGNITFVTFNGLRTESPGDGKEWDGEIINRDMDRKTAPGISNEDFHKIRHFPKLTGISLQHQPVTNEGYAVLRAFPEMEAISLANIKTSVPREWRGTDKMPTSELFYYLDGMRDLKVWDTTHSFGFQDDPDVLKELQGYPELRVCIVDRGHADDFEELYPFLQKSPKLEQLKLHRCSMTEDEIKQILDVLPNLKRLDMKPAGNEPGKRWSYRSLRLLKDYPNLKYVRLIHGDALPLPWEDGLEHLVDAKNITHLEFPLEGSGPLKEEDIARLMQERPDLTLVNLPESLLPEGVDQREHRRKARDEMNVNPMPYNYAIGPR